jgi:hypothetical protein
MIVFDEEIKSFIEILERSNTEEEFNNIMIKCSQDVQMHNALSQKIVHSANDNEKQIKSLVLSNTENIIRLFNFIRDLKEDVNKSKKGLETMSSKMLM